MPTSAPSVGCDAGLARRGMIPDDRELLADLTGVEYGYALREGRDAIILEKKRI